MHTIKNDPVYGDFELQPESALIIDHPKFQRLKDIKQLGHCYTTHPIARHTRFEHCIGTAHLASIAGQRLKDISVLPEGKNAEKWLEWAGLLHDVGHGPMSHTFDACLHELDIEHDVHEVRSAKIAEEIFNDLNSVENKKNDLTPEALAWVQYMIEPQVYPCPDGRYAFLGTVVNNSAHGIDVDKMDYLQRDAHHMGGIHKDKVATLKRDIPKMLARISVCQEDGTIAFDPDDRDVIIRISILRQQFFREIYMDGWSVAAQLSAQHAMKKISEIAFGSARELASMAEWTDRDLFAAMKDNGLLFTRYVPITANTRLQKRKADESVPLRFLVNRQFPCRVLPKVPFADGQFIERRDIPVQYRSMVFSIENPPRLHFAIVPSLDDKNNENNEENNVCIRFEELKL